MLNENNIYFFLDKIKYVIKFENKKIVYYKNINDELIELTDEELKHITKIMNDYDDSNFYSEKLDEIIKNNSSIKPGTIPVLQRIEQIIPDLYKENFYNNLKTLKCQFAIHKDDEDFINDFGLINGAYNFKENTIKLNLDYFLNKNYSNKDDMIKETKYVIGHEFLHLASTKYDEQNGIYTSGVHVFGDEDDHKNLMLTEGMTEVLNYSLGDYTFSSGYFLEFCIANQLLCIVGSDVFLEAYFSGKGLEPLYNKLNNILNIPDLSYQMFRLIEIDGMTRNKTEEQNILSCIQNEMLLYLNCICNYEFFSPNFDKEKFDAYLDNFEKFLITPELVGENSKYKGLDENIKRFNEIRDFYNQEHIKNSESSVK